jgi:2-oxoglutarate/2-oxoacid ferredoxin oxidoreductase subunit alpha
LAAVQDYSIKVGGEAGQGIDTIGSILTRAFAEQGLHLFAHQDYYSRVRGGHNFYQIRIASFPLFSYKNRVDLLIALDKESIDLHSDELRDESVIIYDKKNVKPEEKRSNSLVLPMAGLGKEHGGKSVMGNSVAAGAVWQIMGGEESILENVLNRVFQSKGREIAEANIKAARAGSDFAAKNFTGRCDCSLDGSASSGRMVITGNDALALGSLAAGCRFMSSYPMTPASGVMAYLARQAKRLPLVFEQAEDEIAAINMSIGAANCGMRSMVATSGSGFSLMVEGLAYAGISETPIVILLGQRPGPATGMATRTEQGELLFSLQAGNGEFPRAIFAPTTAADAFWIAAEAFNVAEKYQVPVFILSDQHLADSSYTVEPFDLNAVSIERGDLPDEAELGQMSEYKRYRFTESGISPRAFPGQGNHCVVVSGNEHLESGYSTENPEIREKMVAKRMRKLKGMSGDIMPPVAYGSGEPETVLLTWGSSYGACREAADLANGEGEKWQVVHLPQLWPFPKDDLPALLDRAEKVVTVEMNATGQLGRLLRTETGRQPDQAVLKYDGRPMNARYVLDGLEKGGVFPWL